MDIIVAQQNVFEKEIILGLDVYVITFTHRELRFSNRAITHFATEYCGVKEENISPDFKGGEDKYAFFDAVINSEGPTVIYYSGHGREHELKTSPSVTYQEFGDAILESNNIANITIILDCCLGYDFAVNLYKDLYDKQKESGIEKIELPVIITAANKDSLGWGGANYKIDGITVDTWFLATLYEVHEAGSPLTGKDIMEAEEIPYAYQDTAVLFPAYLIGEDSPKPLDILTVEEEDSGYEEDLVYEYE